MQRKLNWKKHKLFFVETSNHYFEISLYKGIGVNYLLAEENDSSLLYFHKAKDLAVKYKDTLQHAEIYQNMGVVTYEMGDYAASIQYLKKSVEIDSAAHNKSGRVYANLARAYFSLNQMDSAKYFINKSMKIALTNAKENASALSSVYEFLTEMEEDSGNYQQALLYHREYCDYLVEMLIGKMDRAVVEAEKKYRFEMMQKENISLSWKHLYTQRILLALLLAIAVSTIIYYRILLRKDKQLTKANEEVLMLTEQLTDYGKTKTSYQDNLVHKLNILKRTASLEYFIQDTGNKQGKLLIKRFNEIAYGQESIDWEVLYDTINSVHIGLFDKVRLMFDSLDETEFKICCLIYTILNSPVMKFQLLPNLPQIPYT